MYFLPCCVVPTTRTSDVCLLSGLNVVCLFFVRYLTLSFLNNLRFGDGLEGTLFWLRIKISSVSSSESCEDLCCEYVKVVVIADT